MRFRCVVCNWIYDEDKEGKKFDDLLDSYPCPLCGALKKAFVSENGKEKKVLSTVADKIIDQLTSIGVKRIYGIPGESNLPLVEAIRRNNKMDFILTRHEATAAFMASAHGKLTGELGVCLSIAGPGTTNLITGLIDAATDGAPVLALTGQVPQLYLGSEYLQEIDQIELYRPFTVFSETIAKASQAIMLTSMAVKKAYSKMGVAHLSLPTDILAEGLDEEIWEPKEHVFKPKIVPREKDLDTAVELINTSKRPVILGGWGIRNSGKKIIKFAEKISAPIVTTSRAKGAVPETRDNVLGVIGAIGTTNAARALIDSDLLIVLGSGFRQRNLLPDVPVIQIDIDGVKLGKSFPVKVGLIGDAEIAVIELHKRVTKKELDEDFFRKIGEIKKAHLREINKDSLNMNSPISPGYVIQSIKRNVEKNALICVDVGDHTYWFYKKYMCDNEETLLSSNMASMGFALPAAMASQYIYPKRQIICVTGDGGFAMVMADFTTAVYNKLPIKVIVFNDGKLKNITKEQATHNYPEYGVKFINPDFAAFAESCGGIGIKVDNPKYLDKSLKDAFSSSKPAIVDIHIDPEKIAPATVIVPNR
tara:strand:- start:5609 stop:7381 length:1773 start_codon:yes stop_codon:yes gene_type:complete